MSKGRGYGKPIMERFNDSIDLLDNGCWQWNKSLAHDGYGVISLGLFNNFAHRFSYAVFVDEIPKGRQLDHLCRNRGCVNPEHLEPVTVKENLMRGEGIAAKNAKKTICPQGHAYTGTNNRGDRICHMCMRSRKERVLCPA